MDARDNEGRTALFDAARNFPYTQTSGVFISDTGPDSVAMRFRGTIYPLRRPTDRDLTKGVRVLVSELGADIEARDNKGRTAIFAATADKRPTILKALVDELGANIEAVNNEGQTILDVARKLKSDLEVDEILSFLENRRSTEERELIAKRRPVLEKLKAACGF